MVHVLINTNITLFNLLFFYFVGKTKRAFLIRGSEMTRNNRAERLVTIEI